MFLGIFCMETIYKKLILRSWRRGTKEMDLILGRFADKNIARLNDNELSSYKCLLKCDDHLIYNWILGKEKIPSKFKVIVNIVQKSVKNNICVK